MDDDIKPFNPLDYIKTKEEFDDYVSALVMELERENVMLRARNERLEKELAWTEGALNNAADEVEKLRRYVEKNNE